MSSAEFNHLLEVKKYEVISKIGEGAFGVVYLVLSKVYNSKFVVKQVALDENDMCKEVNILMMLDHQNIIKVYDFMKFPPKIGFIIFEYCELGSITDIIKQSGPISPIILHQYAKEIALAVQYCHKRQIVHRDIKPSNILVDQYLHIKLSDFGMSQIVHKKAANPTDNNKNAIDDSLTITGIAGSYLFLAPEVLDQYQNSAKRYDPFKVDVWALGVTFFIMATGVPPWYSSSRETLRKMISVADTRVPGNVNFDFANLIRNMLKIDPNERYTIDDVLKNPLFNASQLSQSAMTAANKQIIQGNNILLSSSASMPKKHPSIITPKFTPSMIVGKRLSFSSNMPKFRTDPGIQNLSDSAEKFDNVK